MEHVTFKHKRTTLERAEKFISSHHFTDINLRSRLYPKKHPLKSILNYPAPGRISYQQAITQQFKPTQVGHSFGRTWATHWFKLELEIPTDWAGQEVHLIWNSQSEALIWKDGQPVQGLSGENNRGLSDENRISFPLQQPGTTCQVLYIEMACNGLLGCGLNGMINPPDFKKCFTLQQAELAVFDRQVYKLMIDVEILHDMAKELSEDSERGYQALYTVNKIINIIEVGESSSYNRAKKIADMFFNQKNGDSQHTIYAMGHSHIDTVIFTSFSYRYRLVISTSFSYRYRSVIFTSFSYRYRLVNSTSFSYRYKLVIFTSFSYRYRLVIFTSISLRYRLVDGNIPSGEAFVRQFLYGQRYFLKEFGIVCKEFWLPDTFGYSAQLPQIMEQCGISRFLTQKLSWNIFNKFPHHTFWWNGIDGSRVLTHFPPGDSYHMVSKVKELIYTLKNYRDKGRSGRSCYLYGYGDGGNGPTEEMVNKLERMENVDGLPRVKMATPNQYFSDVEKEDIDDLCTWSGELYLEMHNGTYTTHAEVKKQNRKCEVLLHDVEFLATMATVSGDYDYPRKELDRLWKLLLLNQFHDVLPGSSIGMVYEDAHRYYRGQYSSKLDRNSRANLNCDILLSVFVNTLGWTRCEIISLPSSLSSPLRKKQKAPSYGLSALDSPSELPSPVTYLFLQGSYIYLENSLLSAILDSNGRVTSLTTADSSRNLINGEHPANQIVLFDDIPLYWDAWDVMDYHLETRKVVDTVNQSAEILDKGPLRVTIKVCLRISAVSSLEQYIILDAGCPYIKFINKVSWHENRKFLKVEFPTSIHTNHVSFDIQFGFLQRPNNYNTSWDSARFEVCGHKWADISDYNSGLAVLNDCKYGYSAVDGIIRLSLLRSPKAPDENADMGEHEFTYAIMPHQGILQSSGVIQQSYNLNSPLLVQTGDISPTSYFSINTPQIILDTVKLSEDSKKKIVLRLYESFGGNTTATISTPLKNLTVQRYVGYSYSF
ncbi:hypothetical protein LOTGIDRAFT_142661 [Lottia gigantea]|uniref:alpha-mannosidase n=1 Tax=Lottia gigantea TaxID=225164 RepID=V4AN31_LOTGI|nr:hypothetical protein LOTGIDRAFT_142661 [Lottia gigantea]ESO98562.1 hypothetical protein LOTGIDRAFT_142661 [Lottia gigantea]